MAYLKHVPTGDVYPYNPDLAKRDDMVACDANGALSPEPEVQEDPSNAPPPAPPKAKRQTVQTAHPDEFLSGLNV